MGRGRWDTNESRSAYESYSTKARTETREQTFRSRNLHPDLDPSKCSVRESCDSELNPNSTPIIVALDVTGSMGQIAHYIAKEGLGKLFESILEKSPVPDPHLMFMAIGDVTCDSAPLQVSQFEADSTIIDQLSKIYVEGGGGGNQYESYNAAWHFAAQHTVHDAMKKRGRRGYLFTVGDERVPKALSDHQLQGIYGRPGERSFEKPLMEFEACNNFYDTYHVIIEQGHHYHNYGKQVDSTWRDLIGQKAINLKEYEKLAETVVSVIQLMEGDTVENVSAGWKDAATGHIIDHALERLAPPA